MIRSTRSKEIVWVFSIVLALLLGCSGDDEADENEIQATQEEAEAEAADDSDEINASTEEEMPGEAVVDQGLPEDNSTAAILEEMPVDLMTSSPESMPMDSPPPEASANQTGKSVWFVKGDAPVYERPDESANVKQQYKRGDNVLVTVVGEWGDLGSGRWVKMDSLSKSPVGRKRSARAWKKISH